MTFRVLKSASFVFVSSLLVLSACSSSKKSNSGSGGTGGGGTGGTGGAGGSGGVTVQCQEPAQVDVTGTWAAKVRMTVNLQGQPGAAVTLCPTTQTQEALLYMYLDVQQNPTDPKTIDSITPHVCSVTLPVVTGQVGGCDTSAPNFVSTQLQVLDPLKKAFPKIQLAGVNGSLDTDKPGAALTAGKLLFVAGSSVQGSAMPGWNTTDSNCDADGIGNTNQCDTNCVSDCSKTVDNDNDGYPGITLGVCGLSNDDKQANVTCNIQNPDQGGATIQGKAWLDLQIDPSLNGTVKSSCEITGNVNASILYNVLGADVWLSGAPLRVTAAITSLPTFQVDPAKSAYRMLRVDGKHGAPAWNLPSDPGQACQAVLQHQNDF